MPPSFVSRSLLFRPGAGLSSAVFPPALPPGSGTVRIQKSKNSECRIMKMRKDIPALQKQKAGQIDPKCGF
jgi:hypothetical protein